MKFAEVASHMWRLRLFGTLRHISTCCCHVDGLASLRLTLPFFQLVTMMALACMQTLVVAALPTKAQVTQPLTVSEIGRCLETVTQYQQDLSSRVSG